jgi:polyhydroxybutyrate depolymerase
MQIGKARALTIAFVAVAASASACSSAGSAKAEPPSTTNAPSTTSAARTRCTPAAGYTPGTTQHTITVNGVPREFLVHMPPRPTPRMRLVVDFHGAGSNMQQQDLYSNFDASADQYGFVVASPNGIDAPVRQWRFLGTRDDVNFAKQLVPALVADACVDPEHAYAVGISSGSAMAASLACQASDTYAGFGLVAGNFYLPPICASARRRPIISFHGTADAAVPYGGGRVLNSALPVGAEEKTMAAWAAHNGCRAGPITTRISSEVTRLSWSDCAAPVVLFRIEGGGHSWPGAISVPRLGYTTHQISATTEMWSFFRQNT